MKPAGWLLILLGVWGMSQLFKGGVLDRLLGDA